MIVQPIKFIHNQLFILDQNQLPDSESWLLIESVEEMNSAILNLSIRGAPLLGLAGIYGMFLAAKQSDNYSDYLNFCLKIRNIRPTAVNLSKTVDELLKKHRKLKDLQILAKNLLLDAFMLEKELMQESQMIVQNGLSIIQDNDCILTHCNTGSLATLGLGTALGIIKEAYLYRKNISVLFTETRPLLQGARLTYYELMKNNIPSTMIIDNSVGFFMQKQTINKVIVGADRIAYNGDTANKIGTYTIAILAKKHSIPFYISAPTSTIDYSLASGDHIKIEFRDPMEVKPNYNTINTTNFSIVNPAFDVTPNELITGFITEKGLLKPPFRNK